MAAIVQNLQELLQVVFATEKLADLFPLTQTVEERQTGKCRSFCSFVQSLCPIVN